MRFQAAHRSHNFVSRVVFVGLPRLPHRLPVVGHLSTRRSSSSIAIAIEWSLLWSRCLAQRAISTRVAAAEDVRAQVAQWSTERRGLMGLASGSSIVNVASSVKTNALTRWSHGNRYTTYDGKVSWSNVHSGKADLRALCIPARLPSG